MRYGLILYKDYSIFNINKIFKLKYEVPVLRTFVKKFKYGIVWET